MKIGIVVNEIATEQDDYSEIRLGWKAINQGHEILFMGLGDYLYDQSGAVFAMATRPGKKKYKNDKEFLADIQRSDADREKIDVSHLDVLLLRSDPADDATNRPWASPSGLLFAQLAAATGDVIVLNDPTQLMNAANKTYFQHFPEEIRPRTCITRDPAEIRDFIDAEGGKAAIKPLQGSGGHNVFVVTNESESNLNQMIEAVTRDGYALVQEYLPGAKDGDVRLLTLNGRPLEVEGRIACFRRYNESSDPRSNISAGGKVKLADPDDDMLRIAEIVAPKLVRDGMYLAGLDIVGDKVIEINVDTPGGINMIEDLTDIDFSSYVLDDLERKLRLRTQYKDNIDNLTLSML